MNYRLLIAEDDAVMAQLLIELATKAGFIVEHYSDGKQAAHSIANNPPDALLTDIRMPGQTGIELTETVSIEYPNMPVAIITGFATVPDVVRAFRAGAIDLLTKPFDNKDVKDVLARFQKLLNRERKLEALTARIKTLEGSAILPQADSSAMQEAITLLNKVATLETPVLLNGETGTGKGVLARAIHTTSHRHEGPWLSINCAALADSVAESELFGHERGSFTGATARKRGVLELAHGGTLFLDEINSASSAVQTRLLEFTQDKTLRRVGGEQTMNVDVRLIVASNQDLQKAVDDGEFREDLWYRLNVFPINIPPLRERYDDILPLAEYFLHKYAQELQRPARFLTDDAEKALLSYSWPGNVRELENCIHRAVVLADEAEVNALCFPHFTGNAASKSSSPWREDASLAEVEKLWIQDVLKRCDNNKTKSARLLGIDVSTLHRKLREMK